MLILYRTGIYLYFLAAKFIALFRPKVAKFVSGRKDLFERIRQVVDHNVDRPIVWIHCSSAGEFEQARPLIEKIKKDQPHFRVFLTFFSPSGYELRKNYPLADWVFYMPIDTPSNARRFLDILVPEKIIFIKCEFWYCHLLEIRKRKIDCYVVSAIFRKRQYFFKWYGIAFRKGLYTFTSLFVQNEESEDLLRRIGLVNVYLSGDTRFDRVCEFIKTSEELSVVKNFIGQSKVWVAGSTWQQDEDKIYSAMDNADGYKLIIASHEVSRERIERLERRFAKYNPQRYTLLSSGVVADKDSKVLIIDTIGILSIVYKYAEFAYVGGGFGSGIHNILEPAAYSIPVIFGPKYRKFWEAVRLLSLGAAYTYNTTGDLASILKELTLNDSILHEKGEIAGRYVKENIGATDSIMGVVFQ